MDINRSSYLISHTLKFNKIKTVLLNRDRKAGKNYKRKIKNSKEILSLKVI